MKVVATFNKEKALVGLINRLQQFEVSPVSANDSVHPRSGDAPTPRAHSAGPARGHLFALLPKLAILLNARGFTRQIVVYTKYISHATAHLKYRGSILGRLDFTSLGVP